ncbi:diaminobutyrate acetyltransferase [Malaciobacter molluscorum]|uniref:diaminobutyrate acetyltransferase n=1 Tax=Malaciobacter molluscorum TaxID=1032072 RepID=UPI00100BDC9A|nr:diaminobutyrate acetyltransferase [Malaciobacter molluscorum]RXJ97316.1 diaminobutyrate acetyltransferase [Malaciobacter molluscorum]
MGTQIKLTEPEKSDGKKIFNLINRCKPLDVNSEYLYLLQSTYFSNTCSVAKIDNEVIGFISGYLVPNKSDTLFIWQVAVDERARGKSVAKNLLLEILNRECNNNIKYIHTTISPDNKASQRFFEKFAKDFDANVESSTFLEIEDFNNAHEKEVLYKIGPLNKGKK